jgi:hypothetical protein
VVPAKPSRRLDPKAPMAPLDILVIEDDDVVDTLGT